MTMKICIITGASSGIGKEAALSLAQTGGYKVILGCRSLERGMVAKKELEEQCGHTTHDAMDLIQVDMSLRSSIDRFVDDFTCKYDHFDVLIHNAADFDIRRTKAEYTEEGSERIWATNFQGPV